MSQRKTVEPCCDTMAASAVQQILGVAAYLPGEADPKTGMFAPIHLYFNSVERRHESKLRMLLDDMGIEFLIWTRLDINFCPFCGHDWRAYSLGALDRLLHPESSEAESPTV